MQQFLTRATWQNHIEQHLAMSTDCKVHICPHPRCKGMFKMLEDRGYHLQDVHCWIPRDVTRPKAGLKRSRSQVEEEEELVVAEGNVEKPRKRSKRSTASVRGSSAVGRRALPGCSTFNLNDNFSKSNFYLDPYFSPDTRLLFQHSALVRLRCLTHRRRWIFVPRNSPM